MPGVSFLFWNLNKKPLEARVGRIAVTRGVDVVLLTEAPAGSAAVLAALNASGPGTYQEADQSEGRLIVLTRLPRRAMRFQFADPWQRYLIFRVHLEFAVEFFLVVAHLPSKVNIREATQSTVARTLAADIAGFEDRRRHRRTVLVGDLNMNPFEEGVAGADALHGVMARAVAGREDRVVQGRTHRMFYNPMWSQFGDRTPGPPGTYYRSAAEAVNYFWNTYDQVLVRPALADQLTDLEVLDSDGSSPLLTPNGIPDKANGSDHLPLYFRLNW